MIGNYTFALS